MWFLNIKIIKYSWWDCGGNLKLTTLGVTGLNAPQCAAQFWVGQLQFTKWRIQGQFSWVVFVLVKCHEWRSRTSIRRIQHNTSFSSILQSGKSLTFTRKSQKQDRMYTCMDAPYAYVSYAREKTASKQNILNICHTCKQICKTYIGFLLGVWKMVNEFLLLCEGMDSTYFTQGDWGLVTKLGFGGRSGGVVPPTP